MYQTGTVSRQRLIDTHDFESEKSTYFTDEVPFKNMQAALRT